MNNSAVTAVKTPTRPYWPGGGTPKTNIGATDNAKNSKPILHMLAGHCTGVHWTKNGFRANCPNGHKKAKGSLSVTVADDGNTLMHCFACQDTAGIMASMGLTLADLFPDGGRSITREGRRAALRAHRQNAWAAALRVLSFESLVVVETARAIQRADRLTDDDMGRLSVALDRVQGAREVLAP